MEIKKKSLGNNIIKSGFFPTSFTNSDILLLYNIIITSPIPTTLTDTKVKNYGQNFCNNKFSAKSKIFGLRLVSFWSLGNADADGSKKLYKGLTVYYYHKHIKEIGLTIYQSGHEIS